MFYFDEELQEWVDDESGEVEVPLPPREELKYRNEPPSPPSFGRSGKYVMGKLPNDYVPEERPQTGLSMPSMLAPKDYGDPMAGSGPYDPETSAMITGYGKNLMMRKAGNPNEQPWLTPGGSIAPPEYVQDIEKTMGELDRGEMSETQLGEKIKRQEKPPGLKPTGFDLETYEGITAFRDSKMQEIRERAEAVANANFESWKKGKSATHVALKGDEVKGLFFADSLKDSEKDLDKFIDLHVRKSLEKSQQATEMGIRERAAKGDVVAIAVLKQMTDEKTAADVLKRTISDRDLVKPLINNLPKAKEDAVQANIRIQKYEGLIGALDKGAGGFVSGLKGMLASVGEAVGVDMSEEQVYRMMARSAIGSQRLALVGSGQVSNYEQKLLWDLAGGSVNVARASAKKLFEYYIKESVGMRDAYNMQIDALSEEYPKAKTLYGYVGKSGNQAPPQDKGGAETGGEERVAVIDKDGKSWTIPARQLEQAISQGYRKK